MEQGYLYLHNHILPTLLAISEAEHQRGLMHQEWPPPIMSFIHTEPRISKFWMHRTPSPLDIVFCYQGKVARLHVGQPHSTTMIGDNKFSDLIVELPYGMVDKLGIKIGHSVGLVKPTPEELRKIISEQYHILIKV